MTTALRAKGECIIRTLRDAGHEALFAGGCVRDMVMGVEPKDFDIATNATPDRIVALFDNTIPVGAQFGVIIVHTEVGDFEVATFRSDAGYSDGRHPDAVHFCSAEEDVQRRDFTINGMLYNPVTCEIFDWVGGREDIRRKVVRTIGEAGERFAEDKLRIMRAVRFAARLSFAIEHETYDAMIAAAPGLTEVSPERIRDELVNIMTHPHAGRGLRLMHDAEILRVILPEVESMAGVEQPPQFHPEGDVFEHTCMMLDDASNPSPELAMGLLLHDIGKPGTQTFEDRIRFNEHDREGALLARSVCRRLRFSNDETDHIVALVDSHMRFALAKRMRLSKLKALLGMDRFGEHLELHRLDCMASHEKVDIYDFLVAKLDEMDEEEIAPEPLATGADLIAMGREPGPRFREILDALRVEQLEERLTSHDEALAWIREHYPLTKGTQDE